MKDRPADISAEVIRTTRCGQGISDVNVNRAGRPGDAACWHFPRERPAGGLTPEMPNHSGSWSVFANTTKEKSPILGGLYWSEREDLNLRPLVSQARAGR